MAFYWYARAGVAEAAWAETNAGSHRCGNARRDARFAETLLTASNVSSTRFQTLISYAGVYGQPLIINNVNTSGKGAQNVAHAAPNDNRAYAFDADSNLEGNSQPLWRVSFQGPGVTLLPALDVPNQQQYPCPSPIGVMGRSALNKISRTTYAAAPTKEAFCGTVPYKRRRADSVKIS